MHSLKLILGESDAYSSTFPRHIDIEAVLSAAEAVRFNPFSATNKHDMMSQATHLTNYLVSTY